MLPEIGSPSTVTCFSNRCQPRGLTIRVATSGFSLYCLPCGLTKEIVSLTASHRLICPSMVPFQVGECECLLDDARRLAEKAKAAGVDVTLDVWNEMIHVFQAFAAVAPEGEAGIRRIAEYLDALD